MALGTNIMIEGVNFIYYEIKEGSFTEFKKLNESNILEGYIRAYVTIVGFTDSKYSEEWQRAKFKDTRRIVLEFKKNDSHDITLRQVYEMAYLELFKLDEFKTATLIS